jgi:calcineurin-like phosphoesterase family protein
MLWVTSDIHFGHERIIPLCNRPFKDVHHMNEFIIKNWNERVAWDDPSINLGDVALGPFADSIQLVKRLSGRKALMPGNHDRIFSLEKEAKRERFMPMYEDVFEGIFSEGQSIILSDGSIVMLSHFPYNGDSHDGDRFEEARLYDSGTTLLHGHTHSKERVSRSKKGTLQIHVGVDAWNYCPVSEDEIIALIKENA